MMAPAAAADAAAAAPAAPGSTWGSLLLLPLAGLARTACFRALDCVAGARLVVADKASGAPPATFGDAAAADEVVITVADSNAWARLLVHGVLGFGEAYMHGEIVVSDLPLLIEIFIRNRQRLAELHLLPSGVNALFNSVFNSRLTNSIRNALGNISAHYDIGNDMFSLFLDETLTYSCPIWDLGRRDEPLRDAQLRKIHAMIDKARIQPGEHVLEIGSGWGSLAMEAVRRTGCRVTTLTLSREQKVLAEQRIAAAGLADRIDVVLTDYRTLPLENQFDRIVSVEMLEAVGPEYLIEFFARCHGLVNKDHGVVVFQVITIAESRYAQYLRKVDFIQKYIFPGGHLPTVTHLTNAINEGSAGLLVIDDIENIGPHYKKALRLWREKFIADYAQLQQSDPARYDDVFRRKWEFYFAYCEGAFATRTLGDVQVVLTRVGDESLCKGIVPF